MDIGRQLADLLYSSNPEQPAEPQQRRIAQLVDPERLRRLGGIGEAALTFGTGLAGSVPAGLAGMAQMIPTRGRTPDVNKAAQTVEDVQGALTYIPRGETGQRVLQRGLAPLEMLGAPAEYIGEKTLQYTGSPGAATAANVLLDPVNFIGVPGSGKAAVAGTKAAGRAAAAAPRVAGEMAQDLLMGQGRRESQRGAIKLKGGNWLAGEVEGATEPLRPRVTTERLAEYTPEQRADPAILERAKRNDALNNWIDKKLNRYIRNEMATPEDPVRKLADQGISHIALDGAPYGIAVERRGEAGFPKEGYATTPQGQVWEAKTDASILFDKAGQMGDPSMWGSPQAFQSYIAMNPWVAKAAKEAPETPIYEMAGRTHTLGFDHLIDELKNSIRPDSDLPAHLRWKPEDLEKVTMEQAVRRVHDINEYRAAKKAEANEVLARNPATVTFKEYPTVPGTDKPNEKGLAWKEIKEPSEMPLPEGWSLNHKKENDLYELINPNGEVVNSDYGAEGLALPKSVFGKKAVEDAIKYEGDVMGHCVGGYCDDVLSGRSKIYSLRDKKGEPHVTIEVKPKTRSLTNRTDWFTSQPEDVQNRITTEALALEKSLGTGLEFGSRENWQKAFASVIDKNMGEELPVIEQIKGSGKKDSSQRLRIKETGYKDEPDAYLLPFIQDFVRSGNWSLVNDIQNTGLITPNKILSSETRKRLEAQGVQIPKYMTEQEAKELSKQAIRASDIPTLDQSAGGMKRGGSVHISDNPDTMALELAAGGAVKAAKAAAKAAEKAVPPKLPRAEPKTKAEIEAIAERIAPQVLGKYVRKSEESAVTAAGKTKKQFEREKELPVVLTGEAKTPSALDLTSLQGKALIGILGDPSITGQSLESVGDIRLGLPSPQHGGPLYGLGHEGEAFWASGKGAAKKVQNLADEVSKQYGTDVLGKYIMMGPEGLNYAQHFADANLQAIDLSKMTKRQIEEFNDLIRKGSPASGPRPSFPGIEDKGSAYLHFAMDPKLRIHFNALMQKPTVTEAFNLPSGQDIRFAITEPALRDLERGVTGMSIGEMRPGAELTRSAHPTYEMDIPGRFLGSSKYPIPYELMFPDTVKAIRANPKQAPQEFGSLGMVGPRQIIDQQLIDELKVFDEQMKKLTGKKKGGAVKMQVGGALKAAAKAAKAAKPDVLPAAEREANLARMLEASQVKSPLYHSSRSPDINTFYSWSHLGTKKAAEDRARQIMQTNPEGVTTYPVHALVKNPLRTEDLGLNQMGFWNLEKLIDSLDPQKVDFSKWSGGKKGLKADYATDQDPSIVEDFLRRNGYDSIVYKNQAEDPGSDSYIIFNPKNIKSATGNRGTFDVTRPEITKKRGGKVSITDNLDTMRLAVQKRK